ncbi:MAG: hypothetical protein KKB21_01800 [Nanoarchaeota archaeon]|nr:hypothetical protein [Nanoarchaeota archaeon]MBU4086291.1 hypothetical protein [Nanoarchaeota archaeon]
MEFLKKRRVIWISVSAVIVILFLALIFIYFYKTNCSSKECFDSKLERCDKAVFIEDTPDSAWQFDIEGKSLMCSVNPVACSECKVNVKLLQIKRGNVDSVKLEGLEMVCMLPFGIVTSPQGDLSRCHGPLKEQMQDLIINRLHTYILSYVGKIGEGLSEAF